MADKAGKGWYAILVGNYITSEAHFPKYILDAILFAKPQFSTELLVQIITYVLSTYKQNEKISILKKEVSKYKKGNISLDDLKEKLHDGLQSTEPILYILDRI